MAGELIAEVEAASRALGLPGGRLLLAVSGGVDSTVLCHAMAELAPRLELRLRVGHVNHGLRGPGSEADQKAVEALAAGLGLAAGVRQVEPRRLQEGRPSRTRPTLQEACRRARYDALAGLAEEWESQETGPAVRIATAHTLDDQAETVLLRLLRGAGPDGLGGIPECSPDGRVVRPLLGVSRADVEQFARERGLSWREDPSNADPAYARSRLRAEWLERFGRDFNPRWLRAVGQLAEAQRRDSEWIEGLVEQEASHLFLHTGEGEARGIRIASEGWAERPEALARRLVRRALRQLGGSRDVSRTHLDRMLRFLRTGQPGTSIELPGGLLLRRGRRADPSGGAFWIGPSTGSPPTEC